MYIARFSYDVLPVHRDQALEFIRQEVALSEQAGLRARLLVPFTRGAGCPALQFEIELTSLDQLDQFRHRGGDGGQAESHALMRAFSEILRAPPVVEILRVHK